MQFMASKLTPYLANWRIKKKPIESVPVTAYNAQSFGKSRERSCRHRKNALEDYPVDKN